MKASMGEYEMRAPAELNAALRMMSSGEGWRPIAGGTDLMVLLNAGKLPFVRLMSLRKLRELQQIEVGPESVSIGAGVTYSQLQRQDVMRSEFPLLCQAAGWTGGIANQNQGTLGGNIANASPAADSAPPLLVYDATVQLQSSGGERAIPYSDFHLGYKRLALREDELIVAVELPRRKTVWRQYGRKVGTRRAQAISKIAIAAAANVHEGVLADLRLAFASVAPVPLRCVETEKFLQGKAPEKNMIANALHMLRAEMAPIDDMRSTAEYRLQVAQNLLALFLAECR